jgi:hypothetical protein
MLFLTIYLYINDEKHACRINKIVVALIKIFICRLNIIKVKTRENDGNDGFSQRTMISLLAIHYIFLLIKPIFPPKLA